MLFPPAFCLYIAYCRPPFREIDKHSIRGVLFVERGSARVPCVCSSFYSLSVPMPLLTDHSDAQVVYIQYSVTLISITFFSCDHRDCYQCLMILIVGMCMGFNMILKFFVTILCFALKHKSEAGIVAIL